MRFDLGFAHHCTLFNTQTDIGMQTDSFNQFSGAISVNIYTNRLH